MSTVDQLLNQITLRSIVAISDDLLLLCSQTAYRLFLAEEYQAVERICCGLLAADHHAWYPYSIAALTLDRQGHRSDALAVLEMGLRLASTPAPLQDLYELLRALTVESPQPVTMTDDNSDALNRMPTESERSSLP